jgi:hypothetical protein
MKQGIIVCILLSLLLIQLTKADEISNPSELDKLEQSIEQVHKRDRPW